MDIYIDVLVIVNCYICWLTLSSASFITHAYIKAKYMIVASFIGGLSSLIILVPSENPLQIAVSYFMKILCLIAIICVAFACLPVNKLIISGLVFLGINVLLAGSVYSTKKIFGDDVIYTNNGIIYFDISITQLIVITAFIYLALVVISRLYSRHSDKAHSYKVEFSVNGYCYNLCAIADTGNLAKDIFSGKPVVICTGISLYRDENTLQPIPVPYSTILGEGILYAYKPESIFIIDETNKKYQVNALVAGTESSSGEIRAIFNPNIL